MNSSNTLTTADGNTKIAVIGSGISGLSASYLLSRNPQNKITLFERNSRIGFAAHSLIHVNKKQIDCPPRSFYEGFYGNLTKLYKESGVECRKLKTNLTISILNQMFPPWFKTGSFMLFGYRIPDFGSELFKVKTWRILFESLRFSRCCINEAHLNNPKMTLQEYLKDGQYSNEWIVHILLPFLSMALTCSHEAVLNYPIDVIMRYMGVLTADQLIVKHGTSDVANRLTVDVDEILLNTTVTGVWHGNNNEKAKLEYMINGRKKIEYFHHIIMASQPSVVLNMLKNPSKLEIQAFNMFKHELSDVVIHKDERLMPKLKKDWSYYNFIIDKEKNKSMATLSATKVFKLNEILFQTWNPIIEPDLDKVLLRVTNERPIMTTESFKAVKLVQESQGNGGIWYIGSYATYSLPLQESCVESAIKVSEQIDVKVSWKVKRWYHNKKKIVHQFNVVIIKDIIQYMLYLLIAFILCIVLFVV